MLKKAAPFALGALLMFGPASVSGQTMDQLQTQLQLLMAQILALQSQTQTAETYGGAPYNASCLVLTRDLYTDLDDAVTHGEVSSLQRFLAQNYSIYPEGRVTGYFGPATERAVQRWQAQNGVVSGGTPDSTGFGFVGPRTRAAMGACSNMYSNQNAPYGETADARQRARDARRIADSKQLQLALELYFDDTGTYPSSLAPLAPAHIAQVPADPLDGIPYSYDQLGSGRGYEIGVSLETRHVALDSDDDNALSGGNLWSGNDLSGCRGELGRYCFDMSEFYDGTAESGGVQASPARGFAPLFVAFSAFGDTTSSYTISYGDGTSAPMERPKGDRTYLYSSHTYRNTGTYTASVVDTSRTAPLIIGSVTVHVTVGTRTATIDGATARGSSGLPTLTGTASGIDSIGLFLYDGSGVQVYNVNAVPVYSGRWSTTLYSNLPSGTYTAKIYSANDETLVLGSGLVTVQGQMGKGAPLITSTSAKAAANFEVDAGGEVTIYGSYLASADSTLVYIGGIPATVSFASEGEVRARVPSSLTAGFYYDLYIVNAYGTSNIARVRVLSNVTTLASVDGSPRARPGDIVQFTGIARASSPLTIALVGPDYAGNSDWNTVGNLTKGNGNAVSNTAYVQSNGTWVVSFYGLSKEGYYTIYIYDASYNLVGAGMLWVTYKG
ncbi:MAG TPA: peptidoglycan-binding protein [Candidatus Paceibacterota bacterium]